MVPSIIAFSPLREKVPEGRMRGPRRRAMRDPSDARSDPATDAKRTHCNLSVDGTHLTA